FSDFKRWSLKPSKKNVASEFEDVMDWIDDSLLSINILFDEDNDNVDNYLRGTLAYIQAEKYSGISQNEVIDFLLARNKALKENILPDKSEWKSLATSSLPLASAIKLTEIFGDIVELGNDYVNSDQELDDKLHLLKQIEVLIYNLPSSVFKPEFNDKGQLKYSEGLVDEARQIRLSGDALSGPNIQKIIKLGNSYFGYTITWVLGAIANKCREHELEELVSVFEELAICCELGLPNLLCAKIYLSGIRSRIASKELSLTLDFILFDEATGLRQFREFMIKNMESLLEQVPSKLTKEWLRNVERIHNDVKQTRIKAFPNFTLNEEVESSKLYVKQQDSGEFFLCSPDYEDVISISSTKDLPFKILANQMSYYFKKKDGVWRFKSVS